MISDKYKIEGDGVFGMKLIKPNGKGSIPLALRGSYTNQAMAEKAILSYIENVGGSIDKEKHTS